MHAMKRMNNDVAVSPIVATLVLIVVAVIGAVAVGTIMGTFSTDVSKKASADQASSAASTELIVAGSTTIQPIAQTMATSYMTSNPGMKITVQGGGSGAGLSGVANGVIDIGMMSEDMTSAAKTAYPNVKQYQVGVSGVVPVVSSSDALSVVSISDVANSYNTGTPVGNLSGYSLASRSSVSGTADTFASAFGITNIYDSAKVTQTVGSNGDMKTWVSGATQRFGFVDAEYALGASGLKTVEVGGFPLGIDGVYSRADIKAAYNDHTSTKFDYKLARPLFLITNGDATSLEKNFITYMQAPGAATTFDNANLTHISELVVS